VKPEAAAEPPQKEAAAKKEAPAAQSQEQAPAESHEIEEGMKLLAEKKYEEAVEYYKTKAKKSPKDPEGWFGLAACLFLTGEIKKCILYYNRCSDIDSQFDVFSRLVKLAGSEYEKFLNLAEHMITLESHKEAKKYIDYLSDKDLPDPLKEKLRSLGG